MMAPSPPPITPYQMNVLRAVTAMAWADGVLEPAEIALMSEKLSQHFAMDPEGEQTLAQEIQQYFEQKVPLTEILPKITRPEDRRLVLKLSYLVIASSSRHPDEPLVNVEELAAFQQLVRSLGLPAEVVKEVASEVEAVSLLTDATPMDILVAGFTDHYPGS